MIVHGRGSFVAWTDASQSFTMSDTRISTDARSLVDAPRRPPVEVAAVSGPLLLIVGFPGPGARLLSEQLDRHADLATCPAIDWIVEYYETWTGLNRHGVIAPELVNKWVDQGRFDSFEVGREAVKGLFELEPRIPFKIFLGRLFDLYGRSRGKRFVGSRCRGSSRDLAALHALWPDARFVHVIEDGRDLRQPLMNDPDELRALRAIDSWGGAPVATLAHFWARGVARCREAGRALGPGLYHEFRYESFCERPDRENARLWAFLGLPPETDEGWPPCAGASGDWRIPMAADEVEQFEAAAGEVLDELGYPRAVGHSGPEAIRLADAVREAFERADPARRREMFQIGRKDHTSPPNPFVFLVGCPRSGTTMLQRILDAHPQVAICPETFWIPYYYKKRLGVAPDGMINEDLSRVMFEYYKFYRMRIGPEALESVMTREGPTAYSGFVSRVFDLYGQGRGKPLVGDKTPDYARNIPTLHALWPEARFVHLIRDGRDVCLSATNWKRKAERFRGLYTTWGEDPVSTAALWWEWHVRPGREAGRALGPGLYHEIRYESLVERPDEESARLCRFLGLSHDPTMLCFHEKRVVSGTSLDAKGAWLPITPGLRNWRSQMPAGEVERFEAAAGGLLDELGYPRAVPRPRPEAERRAAMIREAFERDARSLGDWLP